VELGSFRELSLCGGKAVKARNCSAERLFGASHCLTTPASGRWAFTAVDRLMGPRPENPTSNQALMPSGPDAVQKDRCDDIQYSIWCDRLL
jgi:hypothetical protein